MTLPRVTGFLHSGGGTPVLRKRLDGIFIWSYEVWQLREPPDLRNDPVDYRREIRD
jgi:hypothetical protein